MEGGGSRISPRRRELPRLIRGIRFRRFPQLLYPAPVLFPFQAPFFFPLRNTGPDPGLSTPVPILQAAAEPPERRLPVLVLAPFLPGFHPNAGGKVYEADSALGPVLVLPALSSGGECLHPTLGEKLFVGIRDGYRRPGGAI